MTPPLKRFLGRAAGLLVYGCWLAPTGHLDADLSANPAVMSAQVLRLGGTVASVQQQRLVCVAARPAVWV